MSSTVPRVAAEWMVLHLPSRQGQDLIVHNLETTGVTILTAKELKSLGEILYSMLPVIEESSIWRRRLPSSANKQRRIDFLRRGLFRDDACTIVNDRLMADMGSERRTSSPSTTTSTIARSTPPAASPSSGSTGASAARSTDSRKRPNHQISQHQSRPQQQQQNRFPADSAAAIFNAYVMSQLNAPTVFPGQYRPVQGHGNAFAGMLMNAPIYEFNPPNRMNGQHNNHDRMNGEAPNQIGNESPGAAEDPDSSPQNPIESILLQQLVEMGFAKQEILDGIRQLQSGTTTIPSADEVMLRLVYLREEAEEARREDQVRLISEDQKQEESKRREQNQQKSISEATTGEDLTAIFPDSWVLKVIIATTAGSKGDNRSVSTILCSNSRTDFVEFLKLEEKSRKWYGWILPSEYFRKVGTRLKSVFDTKPIPSFLPTDYLHNEREKLRCGLYELKEQLKGEPKIFLDERKEVSGGATDIVVIDDDDDNC